MDHWFDDLTRTLSSGALSRRTMISWAARLGVATAGAAILGREPAVARADGAVIAPGATVVRAAPAATTCAVQDTYGVLTSIVSASVAASGSAPALSMTHRFIAE